MEEKGERNIKFVSTGGFRHIAWDCRSKKQGVRKERRIDQRGESSKENGGQ